MAEADAASVKAFLPGAPTLKPLEGTVTAGDKAGVVAETLAYALMRAGVMELAEAVREAITEQARILVTTDRNLAASDWHYIATSSQLARLQEDFTAVEALLDDVIG